MTLFERVRMPSFGGATEWLNSEPLGSAELRRHEHAVALLVDLDAVRRAWRLAQRRPDYQLVRQHDAIRDRTLEIAFLAPGAEAYSFTFA
jgi:hypothetical protein